MMISHDSRNPWSCRPAPSPPLLRSPSDAAFPRAPWARCPPARPARPEAPTRTGLQAAHPSRSPVSTATRSSLILSRGCVPSDGTFLRPAIFLSALSLQEIIVRMQKNVLISCFTNFKKFSCSIDRTTLKQ